MSPNPSKLLLLGALVLLWSSPAMAQAIDTTAIDSVLQSILDAMTGTTGRILMTIVVVGVLIAGAMNFLDWSRVFFLILIVVVIGVVPTFIQAIWGSS